MAADMTRQEEIDYLNQHWQLYLANEIAAAYQRAAKKMQPHIIEVAKARYRVELSSQFMEFLDEIGISNTTKPAEAGSEGQGD